MDKDLRKKSGQFYGILSGVLLIYAGLAWMHHHVLRSKVMAGVSLVLLVIYAFMPNFSWVLFQAQQRLLSKVGALLTKIFMIFFFYVIFTPYGFLIQWLRKDVLQRKFEPEKQSYWIERPYSESMDKDCENPF